MWMQVLMGLTKKIHVEKSFFLAFQWQQWAYLQKKQVFGVIYIIQYP